MPDQTYLKYWLVTAAALVVCVVVIFWKPSTTYTASIYREPNYVQQPYYLAQNANCGSLWSAATGDLAKVAAPQYPPPSSESMPQYLSLLTTYQSSLSQHGACGSKRDNEGLILGAAIVVAVVSESLRRRRKAEDEMTPVVRTGVESGA